MERERREKQINILGKKVDERRINSEIHQKRHRPKEKERTKQRNNKIMEREI